MLVQPYLSFEGRCEEALDFYKKALGVKVDFMMRFKDNPDQGAEGCMPPNSSEKVMHSSFKIGESVVMATDGMCNGKPDFKGVTLSISVGNEAEADKTFHALADGGNVIMPLGKTFFSPRFGMVADKFGMSWMVIIPQAM